MTYRALKRQFDLDEDYLEGLKAELIQGQRLAVDEGGEVLVWIGAPGVSPATPSTLQAAPPGPPPANPTATPPPLEAERRSTGIRMTPAAMAGSSAVAACSSTGQVSDRSR